MSGTASLPDAAARPRLPDLTGQWRVVHDVQKSQRSRYVGLKIQFQIALKQDGDRLTGDGEKFLVDFELAQRDEVSRLEITGQVSDTEVRLALLERSPRAPGAVIVGEIVWSPPDAHHMVGAFKVDLAETSGRSEAERRPA